MAFVLKEPCGPSKGIVMFTHKERPLLDETAPVIGPLLRRVRERNLTGMHWGFRSDNVPVLHAIDFHLARESTVSFAEPHRTTRFPFNSSMFAPAVFRPTGASKHWDILSVTRTAKFKHTDQLLRALRLVYDRRPETKALIICSAPLSADKPGHDHGLFDLYLELFSEEERQRCSLLYQRTSLFAFAREDVAFFLNASRVFTLFTEREGASKAIKEALLCGVPVVVRRDLAGGGLDNVSEDNARLFGSIQEAAEALLDAVANAERLATDADTDALARELSEVHSVPRLLSCLRGHYQDLGMPFEGALHTEGLSRRLPAHDVGMLPARLRTGGTADLRTPEAMASYLRHLADDIPIERVLLQKRERAALRGWQLAQRATVRAQGLLRRLPFSVPRTGR